MTTTETSEPESIARATADANPAASLVVSTLLVAIAVVSMIAIDRCRDAFEDFGLELLPLTEAVFSMPTAVPLVLIGMAIVGYASVCVDSMKRWQKLIRHVWFYVAIIGITVRALALYRPIVMMTDHNELSAIDTGFTATKPS